MSEQVVVDSFSGTKSIFGRNPPKDIFLIILDWLGGYYGLSGLISKCVG